MSYNDLRKGRFAERNRIYFVTTVTYQREKLFSEFTLARTVINTMKCLHNDDHVDSLSWVVMPDHLHWLIQLNDKHSLPVVVKNFKAISARSINQYLNREGQVWQKAYYDRSLRQEDDIKQVSRYIVTNPLRAGLVENIGDYSHWDAIWL